MSVQSRKRNTLNTAAQFQGNAIMQNQTMWRETYKGDLSGMMNLGYTGKPYDVGTGLYNYGYRDYKPQAARFTTVDPIRDGRNWYAYVNNDPVNWIDLWGLSADDLKTILNDVVNGIENVFNGVTVVSGVEKTQAIVDLLRQSKMTDAEIANTNAIGLGNYIIVFDNVPPMKVNGNGRVIEEYIANLLGHEAIHCLQAAAAGGLDNFLRNYFSNDVPYLDKPHEKEAYNFGPGNDDYTLPWSSGDPILYNHPEWQL
jgi:RHS repeat-associated protein